MSPFLTTSSTKRLRMDANESMADTSDNSRQADSEEQQTDHWEEANTSGLERNTEENRVPNAPDPKAPQANAPREDDDDETNPDYHRAEVDNPSADDASGSDDSSDDEPSPTTPNMDWNLEGNLPLPSPAELDLEERRPITPEVDSDGQYIDWNIDGSTFSRDYESDMERSMSFSPVDDSDSDSDSSYYDQIRDQGGYDFDVIDIDDEEMFDTDEDEIHHCSAEEYLKHDPTPETQYPRPDWITVEELNRRKYGFASSRQTRYTSMYWFQKHVNNSLWMIQRLERTHLLNQGHTGCVNSLGFSANGNLICSGSDDLSVCIWDWQLNKMKKKINTGHVNNVFQSYFCNSDRNIVTSSRDGTVRLLDVETSQTELLLSTSGEIDKLAFLTPQTIVTCGSNSCVNVIDLRIRDPAKLFTVKSPKSNKGYALHSIEVHPLDCTKVVVAGEMPFAALYDLRYMTRSPRENFFNKYLFDKTQSLSTLITSTAFNSTGDKLLISYSDDDLFLCGTTSTEVLHRYKGHRNSKTIRGCAWFGDKFVLSGSDDGHIYGWDVESEHIVSFMEGDKRGNVNCLLVHPTLPVLASSGLDHDVKVWEPTSGMWPQILKGIKPQICKNTMRRKMAQDRRNRLIENLHEVLAR